VEALVAADARAHGRGEHRDLERLLAADWPAQAVRADLQEDLVGNVVVRGAEQLDEELRKGTRLSVNVDRLPSPDNLRLVPNANRRTAKSIR
jgi:hypothetical protein